MVLLFFVLCCAQTWRRGVGPFWWRFLFVVVFVSGFYFRGFDGRPTYLTRANSYVIPVLFLCYSTQEKAGKRKALTSIESNSESPSLAQKRPAKKKQPAAPVPPEVVTAHRLRPVLADLFRKLRKDDLPVETVHTALTEFDASTGRKETSRGGLEKALRVLEAENRIMYRSYDGNWTVFLI